MMRGMRVAAGQARNPYLEANDGWPTQRVGGGLQVIIEPVWWIEATEPSS